MSKHKPLALAPITSNNSPSNFKWHPLNRSGVVILMMIITKHIPLIGKGVGPNHYNIEQEKKVEFSHGGRI